MHTARLAAALTLAALGAGCAPLQLAPAGLADAPQGATFFAEAVQDLPLHPVPLPGLGEPAPSPLGGGARCGSTPGEQARAQCLSGEGWDAAPARAR